MDKSPLTIAVSLLFLIALPVVAQNDVHPAQPEKNVIRTGPSAPYRGDSNGNFTGRSRGNGTAGFLSPQQQSLLAREPGGQAELQKLSSMTQNDRIRLKTRLQKRWDTLPQGEKDNIQGELAGKMTQQTSGIR